MPVPALRLPRKSLLALLVTATIAITSAAAEPITENVILVTIDGLRWQEVFGGADARLVEGPDGGVRDRDTLRQRFGHEDPTERRQRLLPFLWTEVARRGMLIGDPQHESQVLVTNGHYFSYPGYNEILAGFGDTAIDSNAKTPNRNVTVLEWLNRQPAFQGRVAAFASWDVFPFILNAERSGLYVNAGWSKLDALANPQQQAMWNYIAEQLPHYWDNVRYDIFTAQGALDYLRQHQPRVLYVALGEPDDWAHSGRYDLYLDAAHRNDHYIAQLWQAAQELPQYAGKTALVITTDHGRGDVRDGWKNHGVDYPGSDRIWIAMLGPEVPAGGVVSDLQATQGQIAATVAALVGHDFTTLDPRIAAPLPLKRNRAVPSPSTE